MDEQVDQAFGDEDIAKAYRHAKISLARQRVTELLIWTGIAFLVSAQAIVRFVLNMFAGVSFWHSLRLMMKYNVTAITVSILVVFIPIIVQTVFGDFPLMILQRRLLAFKQLRQARERAGEGRVPVGSFVLTEPASIADAIETGISIEATKRLDPRDLLALYAERTSKLTKRIYARAGVYLLVGVIISFVGIAYFYNGIRDLPQATDYMDHFFGLLPGLGALVFIELVAFIFLRQHRAAMDEFRYFDAVRRDQEDKLILLKMFAEDKSVVSTEDTIEVMKIYTQTGIFNRNKIRNAKEKMDTESRNHPFRQAYPRH